MKIVKGATRTVILVGKYAIKLPGVTGHGLSFYYQSFLKGLLANIQEYTFTIMSSKYCPVIFYTPGGFLSVMYRAEPIDIETFKNLNFEKFMMEDHLQLIGENKQCSFGILNGKIVIVDYGN